MYVYFPLPYHRHWYSHMVDLIETHGNGYDLLLFIIQALRNALTNSHNCEELVDMLSVEFTAGPYRILDNHQLVEDDVGGVQQWFWSQVENACSDLAIHFERFLLPKGDYPRWTYSFIEMDYDYICFLVEESHAPACIY